MKRIFSNFNEWEDWKCGLYEKSHQHISIIQAAYSLLTDEDALNSAMESVVEKWKKAAAFNLSNSSKNRRAWLGQAACCLLCGANELSTIIAWNSLTKEEQKSANYIADNVIKNFEENYAKNLLK
jgi:hypothetical protein